MLMTESVVLQNVLSVVVMSDSKVKLQVISALDFKSANAKDASVRCPANGWKGIHLKSAVRCKAFTVNVPPVLLSTSVILKGCGLPKPLSATMILSVAISPAWFPSAGISNSKLNSPFRSSVTVQEVASYNAPMPTTSKSVAFFSNSFGIISSTTSAQSHILQSSGQGG